MNISLKKKIAAPLAAIGAAIALSAAIPAAAQAHPTEKVTISYSHGYDRGPDLDFRGLKVRIAEGVRHGDLTRSEARRLSARVDALEERADDYSRHGYTRWEREELRDRYDNLSRKIHAERHDRDHRGYAWR